MPSLIGADAGTGINVAGNYRRAFAPFTRFGTRVLAFYSVQLDGSNLSGEELIDDADPAYVNPYFFPVHEIEYQPDGVFATAIQSIQTQTEVMGIFRPQGDTFVVMIADDTANVGSDNTPYDGNGNHQNDVGNPGNYNDMSQSIADAIYNAFDGEYDVYVDQRRIKGDNFNYTDLNGLETPDVTQAKRVSKLKPR